VKLCFVVCTPDVSSTAVTAYNGPLDPFLRSLHRLGYRGVELMMRDPQAIDTAALSSCLSENQLEVALVNTGRVFLDDGLSLMLPSGARREEARHRICALIDFAAAVSGAQPFGPQINAGLSRGQFASGQDRAEARRWAVENLRFVAHYARERGVRIALEPINRYQSNFVNTAQDGLELIREIGTENLGLQMDLFHMNIEERSFAGSFITYMPWITHIHVCDTNREAPGQGHLDFAEIIGALRALGYAGYLSAELDTPQQERAAELTASHLLPLLAAH